MFINPYNSLMKVVLVAIIFFSTSVAFAEDSVSSSLYLTKVTEILNEEGSEKAIEYIYNEGVGKDGSILPTFLEHIASGNSDWFRVLARISSVPLEIKSQFAIGAIAESLVEHPLNFFEYWREVLSKNKHLSMDCVVWRYVDLMDAYDNIGNIIGEKLYVYPPSYITTPMYRGVLEKRRKSIMTIDDIKLKSIKNQCIEQIDSRLALLKSKYEEKLGFISNEKH